MLLNVETGVLDYIYGTNEKGKESYIVGTEGVVDMRHGTSDCPKIR